MNLRRCDLAGIDGLAGYASHRGVFKVVSGQSMAGNLPFGAGTAYFSSTEERAILMVTCLVAFLFFNSFGSIGVALPAIQKQFGNSLSEIQWIVLMGVVTISSLSF